jgi:hypothetical protein
MISGITIQRRCSLLLNLLFITFKEIPVMMTIGLCRASPTDLARVRQNFDQQTPETRKRILQERAGRRQGALEDLQETLDRNPELDASDRVQDKLECFKSNRDSILGDHHPKFCHPPNPEAQQPPSTPPSSTYSVHQSPSRHSPSPVQQPEKRTTINVQA